MAKTKRCTSKIATLPANVLRTIAKHLPTRIDKLRFRTVCFSFRKSFPLPPKTLSPYIVGIRFPSGPFDDPPSTDLSNFVLREYTVYAFEPMKKVSNPSKQYTWLVNTEELTSGKIGASDPLSGYVTRLSPLHNKSLNLLDYKVTEVAKLHRLGLLVKIKNVEDGEEVEETQGKEMRTDYFSKAVVSKCFDEIGDQGFAIMCLNEEGSVYVWREGDEKWTNINIFVEDAYLQDIVYHNNKFYVIATLGSTFTVDCESLKVTKVVERLPESDVLTLKYLVKVVNDLYLIVRHSYPIQYKLLKLDEEKHEWVKFKGGLEDRLLFVGDWSSFSCKELAGCKGNRLFITYDKFGAGTLNLGNKRADDVWPLYHSPNHAKIFLSPTWLKLRSASK